MGDSIPLCSMAPLTTMVPVMGAALLLCAAAMAANLRAGYLQTEAFSRAQRDMLNMNRNNDLVVTPEELQRHLEVSLYMGRKAPRGRVRHELGKQVAAAKSRWMDLDFNSSGDLDLEELASKYSPRIAFTAKRKAQMAFFGYEPHESSKFDTEFATDEEAVQPLIEPMQE